MNKHDHSVSLCPLSLAAKLWKHAWKHTENENAVLGIFPTFREWAIIIWRENSQRLAISII